MVYFLLSFGGSITFAGDSVNTGSGINIVFLRASCGVSIVKATEGGVF